MSALHDIDGIVLLLIFGVGFVAFLLLAFCIEYMKAAPLRRQRKRSARLQRYCNMIDRDAARLLKSIHEAGEA
ncbi:MAG: hypothetical protein U1F09_13040 [Steroidobacteraceae bacterium]